MDTREKAEFFLKRTEPLPGESLTSLVHRLTYLNRYEDESWIVRLLEPERSRIQKFDLNIHIRSPQMRVLAAKNRTSYERIYEMTSHRFSHLLLPEQEIERDEEGHPFIKDARRAQYVRISRAKFCPVCLQEKKYHRIHWDPVYVTACLDHGVLLKDRCSSCGRPVTTLEVSRGYHRCGSDLSKEKTIGIRGDTLSIETQQHIQRALGVNTAVPTKDPALLLPPGPFFKLLDATVPALLGRGTPPPSWLGNFDILLSRRVANWRYRPNAECHVLLSNAFGTFLNWPQNFFDLLSEWRERGGARRFASLTGPYRPLGRLFDAIEGARFSFVRTAFEQFVGRDRLVVRKNSRFFGRFLPTRRWVALTEAARMLGTSRAFAGTLCATGSLKTVSKEGRVHVEVKGIIHLLQRWETNLPIGSVAKRLGVGRSDVIGLINAGFLKAEQVTAKSRFVRIEDVKRFENRYVTTRKEQRVEEGEPMIGVHDAAAFLRLGARSLTKLLSLMDGDILHPCRDPSGTGLDSLLFARSELNRCKIEPLRPGRSKHAKNPGAIWGKAVPKGRNDQICMSARRLQKLLGISPGTMGRLDTLGLLPVIRKMDRTGRMRDMVDFLAYTEFRRNYVYVAEAISILRITRKELYRWVRAGAIKTVINIGRENSPRFLLKRKEIIGLSSDNRMSIGQATLLLKIPEELVKSMVIEGKLTRIKSPRAGNDGAILMREDVERLKRKMGRAMSIEEFVAASGTPKAEIAKLVASGDLLPLSGTDIDTYRFTVIDFERHMRICSRREAAVLLGVTDNTVENWRKKGFLRSEWHRDLRGRHATFYRVRDLERFRELQKAGSPIAVINLEAVAMLPNMRGKEIHGIGPTECS